MVGVPVSRLPWDRQSEAQESAQRVAQWSPGGMSVPPSLSRIPHPTPQRMLALKLPSSPRPITFPTAAYRPASPQYLPPLRVVPHQTTFEAVPRPAVRVAEAPSQPAPLRSVKTTPVLPLAQKGVLTGVRRPVGEIVQALASRAGLKVMLMDPESRTLTYRLNDRNPAETLKKIALLCGYQLKLHEGVWYMASPTWLMKAFPEPQYTQIVQTSGSQAKDLAPMLQQVLSHASEVQAVGDNNLIIHAPLHDQDTAAGILASLPSQEGKSQVASITLNLPLGLGGSVVKALQASDIPDLKIEGTAQITTYILRGDPKGVVAGLRRYIAMTEKTVPSSSTVARTPDR
jgi:hypothetical protein